MGPPQTARQFAFSLSRPRPQVSHLANHQSRNIRPRAYCHKAALDFFRRNLAKDIALKCAERAKEPLL